MKAVTAVQQAWLESARSLCLADLYTITLLDGTVFRFTSAGIPLTAEGVTYTCAGISITRGGSFTSGLDMEVQTLELDVLPDRSTTDATLRAFITALDTTTLRGARLKWAQWLSDNWTSPQIVLTEFLGNVTDLEDNETTRITAKSDLQLLNIQMPRNVWQPGCQYVVYGAGCGLNVAAYELASNALDLCTTQALTSDLTTYAAGYFQGGGIRFTSGALNGLTVGVKASAGGILVPIIPFPSAPSIGDSFVAWPGCDRQMTTCDTKFGNLANFRGMPFVPTPETTL